MVLWLNLCVCPVRFWCIVVKPVWFLFGVGVLLWLNLCGCVVLNLCGCGQGWCVVLVIRTCAAVESVGVLWLLCL